MVSLKGKTYEIIYGDEKAKQRKELCRKQMKNNNWRGKNHPSWVGNNYKSLSGVHDWIRTRKAKPKYCEHCKKIPPVDLSIKNGKEYSRNIQDYEWLCRKCHMIYDGRIKPKKIRKCKICQKDTINKNYCSQKCSKIGSRKIINRPNKEELLKMLSKSNYVQVGKKFNVSDNCIRKWIK
jgi:hypothetical protein